MKINMYNERTQKFEINFNRKNIEKLVIDLQNKHYSLNKIAIDINYCTDFIENGIVEAWFFDGKDYDLTKQFDDFGAFVVYPNRAKSIEELVDSIFSTIKGMGLILVNT